LFYQFGALLNVTTGLHVLDFFAVISHYPLIRCFLGDTLVLLSQGKMDEREVWDEDFRTHHNTPSSHRHHTIITPM
jgi:hypothetical protein